ncbi:MAG: hypothetical protein AAB092_09400 [Chloroflexota bacterium]
MKTIFDHFALTDTHPLAPFLVLPERAGNGVRRGNRPATPAASKPTSLDPILPSLEARRAEAKLPDQRAFWELMRIVWTEPPRTLVDDIRFAVIKILAMTGLRIEEVCRLPRACLSRVDYFTREGTPTSAARGIDHAWRLTYFVEKQSPAGEKIGSHQQAFQYVPSLFADALCGVIEDVARITAPLRDTLDAQLRSGRLLPQYHEDERIQGWTAYAHLTGSLSFFKNPPKALVACTDAYRTTLDPQHLQAARTVAENAMAFCHVASALPRYFALLAAKGVRATTRDGTTWEAQRPYDGYFRVGDIERYAAAHLPTKRSDTNTLPLTDGTLLPASSLLFLLPKRPLQESRNDVACDITQYAFVGMMSAEILRDALGTVAGSRSLFTEYGTESSLWLTPHSFRHLLNTELFRAGLSDAIITKQFGRTSVAQSYEYDHRSLDEHLSSMSLPSEMEAILGESRAAEVAKLIVSNRVKGPIVDAFRRIQETEGDDAAALFLSAEADGFHVTPYGFCINSFTVSPCPKHLECFNNCRHLAASGLPEHRTALVQLKRRTAVALVAAESRPARTVGRDNQIEHARQRLTAIDLLLAVEPGTRVFPDGNDLSQRSDSNPSRDA